MFWRPASLASQRDGILVPTTAKQKIEILYSRFIVGWNLSNTMEAEWWGRPSQRYLNANW